MTKRDRTTELRQAQKNLLAVYSFKWRRSDNQHRDGYWYCTHGKQWLAIHCDDPIEKLRDALALLGDHKIRLTIEDVTALESKDYG